jgi:hypothetical protein
MTDCRLWQYLVAWRDSDVWEEHASSVFSLADSDIGTNLFEWLWIWKQDIAAGATGFPLLPKRPARLSGPFAILFCGYSGCFSRVKRPEREVDDSHAHILKVKNKRICTPTPAIYLTYNPARCYNTKYRHMNDDCVLWALVMYVK